MKVLLVRPASDRSLYADVPPLGLGYLATAARRAGAGVELWDLARGRDTRNRFRERARRLDDVDVLGFQMYSRDIRVLRSLFDEIEIPERTVVIAGGPHPSAAPVETLQLFPRIDAAFTGESERSLTGLLCGLRARDEIRWGEFDGVTHRDGDRFVSTPQVFELDLDALGPPAWDLIPPDLYHGEMMAGAARRVPVAMVPCGRGCPYHCTYCSARTVDGFRARRHSVPYMIDEFRFFRDRHGVREIKLIDDNLTVSKPYIIALADAVCAAGLDLAFAAPSGMHIHTLDDAVLHALRRMGFYSIPVALESGSQETVERMKKNLDLEHAEERIRRMVTLGFEVTAYFMLGYKDETRAELRRTLDLATRLPLTRIHLNAFFPFPGTPVHAELEREGRLQPVDWDLFNFETVNCSYAADMGIRELHAWRVWGLFRFYVLRPARLWKMFSGVRSRRQAVFIFAKAAEFLGLGRLADRFRDRLTRLPTGLRRLAAFAR